MRRNDRERRTRPASADCIGDDQEAQVIRIREDCGCGHPNCRCGRHCRCDREGCGCGC